MKTRTTVNLFTGILAVALISSPAGSAILTFDFDGSNNVDVPEDYGSNLTVADNSDEFITTDSLGATPNIALTWPAASDILEFHSINDWVNVETQTTAGGTGVNVVQVNDGDNANNAIQFTPDAGFAVVFDSIDFGFGTSFGSTQPQDISFAITRDSDNTVVYTSAVEEDMVGGSAATFDLNYTGDVGQSYTLTWTDVNTIWGAIDDVTFGQTSSVAVPEPASLALLGVGGVLIAGRRRRDA